MDLWEQIKNNTELHTMLMRECDICFYKQLQEIRFMENNENYSMQAKAFAHDASGGEFVLLQDESIGFIGSEGEVGRIAESLAELLTFLIHAGNLFDFNCKKIYQRESLLRAFCEGYLAKIREDKNIRTGIRFEGSWRKNCHFPFIRSICRMWQCSFIKQR